MISLEKFQDRRCSSIRCRVVGNRSASLYAGMTSERRGRIWLDISRSSHIYLSLFPKGSDGETSTTISSADFALRSGCPIYLSRYKTAAFRRRDQWLVLRSDDQNRVLRLLPNQLPW